MQNKPDCYKCRWRHPCIGSAHSMCCHPDLAEQLEDSMAQLMAIFASVGRVAPTPSAPASMGIRAMQNGIGVWFNFPHNFDPVWLTACNNFEAIKPNDPRALSGCNRHVQCDDCTEHWFCCQKKVITKFCDNCDNKFKCATERVDK